MKTTPSDRSPRRSRTKSLFGVLVATALLAGATQALAPASASAMVNLDNEADCNDAGGIWLDWGGGCVLFSDSDGGGSGPSNGSGGPSGGSADDSSSDPSGAAKLPGPPEAVSTPVIVIPVIDTKSGKKYEAIAFPVGRNGLPLMGQRGGDRSSGASPRKANGRHRGRGGIGRRDSSRDDD